MTNKRIQETLTVEDIIEILQISRTGAYQLINDNPPFTVKTIGRIKRISAKSFFDWLDGIDDNKNEVPSAKIA